MNFECLTNNDNKEVDVVITTVPWTDSNIPLMAPAALKPMVEKAGKTCLAIDLNAEVIRILGDKNKDNQILSFFFDERCKDSETVEFLDDLFLSAATQILSWKPKFVGISLFSYVSRASAKWLSYYLKKLNPDIKIIIGGAGCLEQFTGPADFATELIEAGFVDYHIRGDGEITLYELLTGNVNYIGINDAVWQELSNEELEELPIPDYTNYNFSLYNRPSLALQASRGCVRQCTFCDYIENWKKFKWRSAENVFNEMLTQYRLYGIRTFKFQDTLINGNQKEFQKLVTLLADYNEKNPSESFEWGSYYIFRNETSTDEYVWELIAKSGAKYLIVGIENINEDIRYAIGKKFTNQAIDFHMKQAQKHGIGLQLLFIVGYVSETQEHIDFAKNWIDTHTEFQDIVTLSFGSGLGIFPNTFLDRNKEKLDVIMIGSKPHEWENKKINNTPDKRAEWVIDLVRHSKKMRYQVSEELDNHYLLEQHLIKNAK